MLDNPELAASLGRGRCRGASAKAERDRIYSGVRAEEVAIAAQAVRTAEANLVLAEQQHDRAAALAGKNFASRQKLDESTASLAKAQADLDLKRAQAEEAGAGPTAEERALADARVALAEATVAGLQAELDKTRLTAPTDGTVGIRVAEPGEIIYARQAGDDPRGRRPTVVCLHVARGRSPRLAIGGTVGSRGTGRPPHRRRA